MIQRLLVSSDYFNRDRNSYLQFKHEAQNNQETLTQTPYEILDEQKLICQIQSGV